MRLVILYFLLCSSCVFGNKVILVSLDGFRHDYIEKALANGKNVSAFQQLAEKGFRAMEVQSVMLSLTFPSHFSLATGRYVDTHGLVGNTFYSEKENDGYVYTNPDKNLQSFWFTQNGNEPLWMTNERHGHKTGVFYWPGSDAFFNGSMQYVSFGLYNGAPSLQFRVDRVMEWIRKPDVNFCMLYFNQPDSDGHKFGPDSVEVLQAVEETNHGIAYLMQRIANEKSLLEKPNIIVTSDHGMTKVSNKLIVNVSSVISPDEYKFGVDGSPASLGIWNKTGGPSIQELYDRLKLANLPNLQVYLKEDIPESYHYRDNDRIAPLVLIADLGYLIVSNASKGYSNTLLGMHGYNNSQADMHPFLVAAGPDIKQIGTVGSFHQIDVYPLVCLLLGLYEPNKIDGEMARVLPYLKFLPSMEILENFDRYTKGLTPNTSTLDTGLNGLAIFLLIGLHLLHVKFNF